MREKILKVPEWKGKIIFDYEMLHFCLVIAFLVAGLVLCFMGYKYMKTLCIAFLGCVFGALGVHVGEMVTQSDILKMCLFVVFVFAGVAIVYEISDALQPILRRWPSWVKLLEKQYLIAAVLGAGVTAVTVYSCIYRSIIIAGLIFLLLAVTATLYGKKKATNKKVFYTYDDLCARKPICEGEDMNA